MNLRDQGSDTFKGFVKAAKRAVDKPVKDAVVIVEYSVQQRITFTRCILSRHD